MVLSFLCAALRRTPRCFATQNSGARIPAQTKKKIEQNVQSFSWLELGYGNITFTDELDFDVAELDIVYEDSDEGGVDIIAEKDGVHLGAQARRCFLVS